MNIHGVPALLHSFGNHADLGADQMIRVEVDVVHHDSRGMVLAMLDRTAGLHDDGFVETVMLSYSTASLQLEVDLLDKHPDSVLHSS